MAGKDAERLEAHVELVSLTNVQKGCCRGQKKSREELTGFWSNFTQTADGEGSVCHIPSRYNPNLRKDSWDMGVSICWADDDQVLMTRMITANIHSPC